MSQNKHWIDEKNFVEEPLLQQLESLGWKVLRFWSNDIRHNLDVCIQTIEQKISQKTDDAQTLLTDTGSI